MLFGLIVVCLMASSLFAISGATTSGISQLRWTTAVTAGTAPTQGGNITGVNIASTQLTSKWASFNGNVSGTIRLSDTEAGSAVYVGHIRLQTEGRYAPPPAQPSQPAPRSMQQPRAWIRHSQRHLRPTMQQAPSTPLALHLPFQQARSPTS